ncbi:MAG: hypothetical protein WKF77_03520 [Planctomycetaceae bacterium]
MPYRTGIETTMLPQTDRRCAMPRRFCILLHDHPYWHWDFLLEEGDHALCWRLLRKPCCDEPIAAEQLPPHRLLYLDYAGPLSNDRGTVQRIASGTYQIIAKEPVFLIQLTGPDWTQQASLDVVSGDRMFWHFRVAPETCCAQ